MEKEEKKRLIQFELFGEYLIYKNQYQNAIYRLLDKNANIKNMIYPIALLIHQMIENDLKFLVVEPHISGKSFKEYKVDNTHNLKLIFEKNELKKYYDEIDLCNQIFDEYKSSILYFFELLGEDTFLKSRYPFEKETNSISLKNNVNVDDLYDIWGKYCIANVKVILVYIAYCSSNVILFLKKNGNLINDVQELKVIDEIANDMFSELDIESMDFENQLLKELILQFVKRNKYYDINYVQ